MNSEYKVQFRALLKLLMAIGFALLYALGGIEHKWIRRFIAPAWLGLCQCFISGWNWKVLFQFPIMMFSLSLGYGADTLWAKIGKRLIFGCANGFTNIAQIFRGLKDRRFWITLILAVTLFPLIIAVLGALNPYLAREEELIIGLLIGLPAIYIIKDKEKV